jgi:hypothetical protein
MALTPCRLHLLLPENDTKAYVLQEAFFFKKYTRILCTWHTKTYFTELLYFM